MANAATFLINGIDVDSDGNRIYRAAASEVLHLTAKDNPSKASAFTYSIFDLAVDTSPPVSATELANRKNGQNFTFNENGLFSIVTAANESVSLTMYDGVVNPINGPLSFVIRCEASMGDGSTQRFERGVSLFTGPDHYREPVYGEQQQFFNFGWGISPLGQVMANSFPAQSKFKSGTLNSISHANVDIVPGKKSRTLIFMAQVWAQQDGSTTQGLWGLRRIAFIDGSGVITLSANAGGETLDGTISEANFQPSVVVNGSAVSCRLDQKVGGHSYLWKAWTTLMEEVS